MLFRSARFVATLAPADVKFERLFVRYSELSPGERGTDALALIARETQAMEVLGPPLVAEAGSSRSSDGTGDMT